MNQALLALLLVSGALASAQPIEVRIDNETVPAGGVIQLKVGLTDPHPISTGKMSSSFDESFFDSIFGVSLYSPNGDVSGAAVVQGTRISARFSSPVADFGTGNPDYPMMTIVLGTKPGTPVGTKRDVQLDAANSFWKSLLGDNIPFSLKKGTITTGGSLFISNVVPGGGQLPAGTVVSIQGGGFPGNADVTIKDDLGGTVNFTIESRASNEIRIRLTSAVQMSGKRIMVKNPSNNDQIVYYSYLRTTSVTPSSRNLLNLTEPIFLPAHRTSGYLSSAAPTAGTYVGLALQNDNPSTVNVSLDLLSSTGTSLGHAVATLPTGTRYVQEIGEIFGITPPAGSGVSISSGTLIQMLGLAAEDSTSTVAPIAITDAPAAQLSASPATLTFTYTLGGSAPASQPISITSAGGALGFTCASNQTWLTLSPAGGTAPASINASLNTTGLTAGTQQASITCTPTGANIITIPVTLTVSQPTPQMNASPTLLTFNAVSGTVPATQVLTVTSTGAPITFAAAATGLSPSGTPWLSVTAGGTTPSNLTVSVNASPLAAGTYQGSIQLTAPGATQVTVPVVFNVTAAPTLSVNPNSLAFAAAIGGSVPAAQTIAITSSGTAIPVTITSGASWLSVSTNSTTTPITVTATANITGLSLGNYITSIVVTGGGNALLLPVSLAITAVPAQTPATLTVPATGTLLAASTTFTWTNTGAAKYRLDVGRTQGASDLFTGETTATSLTVSTLPQDGSTVYVQLSSFFNSYLAPVVSTYRTLGGTPGSGTRFIPVAPCRIADTRNANGTFGGPILEGGSTRDFPVPSASCGIPTGAQAYSLNITVVPSGPLAFLTAWPSAQARPGVSTLNAFDGSVTSNAAIVPAGGNGSISMFVTDRTHVVVDINGYFTGATPPEALVLYPVVPCRVADTRLPNNSPTMTAGSTRDFPIAGSACNIPATARAYSLNMTVVPSGPLSFLTTYPTGQPRPNVSTLNSFDGSVKANAAIVPAGANGPISVFVTDRTDVVIDINGYFAPPGPPAGLLFYPLAPCRVADTRNPTGLYGGPAMTAALPRDFNIASSGCGALSTAQAYSMNVTVVPPAPLAFLTAWPSGLPRPLVSTLNSFAGKVVANAAIVPSNSGGAVSFFATDPTNLIIDLNGYFAP